MSTVSYNSGITPLPAWAEANLTVWLDNAGVPSCIVTSTLRTPADQARIMYNDLVKPGGEAYVRSLYGKGGNTVVDVAQGMISSNQDAAQVQAAMTSYISAHHAAVSKHIATGDPDQAVCDISPSSVKGGRYGGLLTELQSARAKGQLGELIWPPKDKALHLEFVPGGVAQAVAAAENAVTDATSDASSDGSDGGSSVEGGGSDAPGGIPTWAWLLGGVGAVWYFLKRRK